jgi:uncharacterized protein
MDVLHPAVVIKDETRPRAALPSSVPMAAHAANPPLEAQPTPLLTTAERLHSLDILRGVALFGMILVHFHQKMRLEVTGLEDLIAWAVWIFVEQKAWGIFAFLFGAGFAVFLRRLDARHAAVAAICLRRLGALAVFGVIAEVGFGFDILFTYACSGLILLLVRRWSTPALLLSAALAAMAQPVAAELTARRAWSTTTPLSPGTGETPAQAVDAAAHNGRYRDLLAARWRLFVASTLRDWRGLLPDSSLALFIVGLLAIRHRVLDEPRRHARLIVGWIVFGAASWLISWVILKPLTERSVPGSGWGLALGLGLVRDQWLCLAYIGAVVLLLAIVPGWNTRLAWVGRVGRMALTNYMMQVAVLDALASGYGAGLRLRPSHYALAASLLIAAEAAFSMAWLTRYRFGPMEWIWRTITYAHRQPLRHASRAPVVSVAG